MHKLRHPNIVTVFGGCTERLTSEGEPEPYYCIVMEKLNKSLDDIINPSSPAMDEKAVVELACQIAGALVYLHMQTPVIVHRDLKPANVMKSESGEYKLIDFGMAKVGVVYILFSIIRVSC